jgi:hypothetical protein
MVAIFSCQNIICLREILDSNSDADEVFFWEITWLKLIKLIKLCGVGCLNALFANLHSPAALTEFFRAFSSVRRQNVWVHLAKTGHRPHSS